MAIRETVGVGVPGVAASAAVGLQGQAALTAVSRQYDDASTGATTTTGIVGRSVVGAHAIRRQSRRTGQTIRTNEDDSAARGTAASLGVTVESLRDPAPPPPPNARRSIVTGNDAPPSPPSLKFVLQESPAKSA